MAIKRVVVLGCTGSGKTTLAKKISKELNIPHIQLDSLKWEPNWIQVDEEEFLKRAEKALDREDWVVDGNYSAVGKKLIWPSAQVAIYLDYPFHVTFCRLFKRTLTNSLKRKELWPGCRESFFLQFFTNKSIFYWFFRSFWRRKRAYPKVLFHYPNLKVIHIKSEEDLRNLRLEDDSGL